MNDPLPRTIARPIQFENGCAIGISNRWQKGQYCTILTEAGECFTGGRPDGTSAAHRPDRHALVGEERRARGAAVGTPELGGVRAVDPQANAIAADAEQALAGRVDARAKYVSEGRMVGQLGRVGHEAHDPHRWNVGLDRG